MKKPKISKLRSKLIFYTSETVVNVDYTKSSVLSESFYVWGKIEAKTGYIFNPNEDKSNLEKTHKITTRWDDRIKSTLILKSNNIEYNILSITPLEFDRNHWMLIDVEQVDSGEC